MRPRPKNTRLPHETYADPELQFHVVFHAFPGISTLSPDVLAALWDLVLQQRERSDIELFAACLMPNHLHWVVAPRGRDIIAFVNAWKSFSTKRARDAGHRGVLWQPGWYDRVIGVQLEFDEAVDYVVRNPVTAGLCETPEDWAYTWAWYFGDDPKGAS
jgi:REP element-mobilizing transposase RayT